MYKYFWVELSALSGTTLTSTILSNFFTLIHLLASVAQLDAPSDWRPGGRGFNPRRGRQHSFGEIDHEYFLRSFSPFR